MLVARQRVPEGPPPAPAVQKVSVRYAKRGRLRFSSTRDFQRALERAVRRAGVPMAFSAGFHPHPRISYANAAPTGAASEAEYFQLQLTQQCDLEALRAALDESLPQDMAVLRVVEAAPGALADLLQASVWQLDFEGVTLETITDAVATFMDRAELLVTRMTKSGAREFDVRQAVLASDVVLVRAGDADGRDLVRWTMTIQHTTPAVRPIDVMTGLTELTGLQVPRSPLMTRLAQGVLEAGGRVIDPFDA
ncbi:MULTISPECIES: TIGR03936 family radical SAM-associated protein [Dermacoccus]|uniref:TIGR03936 family radical SAM-associated protein n=1 Tax=Dermacoccus TaxID=57495 RepID=UPI0007802B8C|nr:MULTISPECIES: TIGR03936 family radical SAM-associated protein [Dermacoccus]MCT1603611.1 TIGR03936 family radical SAM-associated protein [Dermacoccus nishinomiyaensis]